MPNRLEVAIAKVGRDLRDLQVAWLWKVPESMQQTPCDFFGFTIAGRAILIECKDVTAPSLKVGASGGLAPHQWAALEDADRANAVALICWARGPTCKTFDFSMAKRLSEGRSSIPWGMIPDRYEHPMCGPDFHLDLLKPYLFDSSTSGRAIS